jgi:hypothetical protein
MGYFVARDRRRLRASCGHSPRRVLDGRPAALAQDPDRGAHAERGSKRARQQRGHCRRFQTRSDQPERADPRQTACSGRAAPNADLSSRSPNRMPGLDPEETLESADTGPVYRTEADGYSSFRSLAGSAIPPARSLPTNANINWPTGTIAPTLISFPYGFSGRSTVSVKTSSSWTTRFNGNGLTLRVSDQMGCASSPLFMTSPL